VCSWCDCFFGLRVVGVVLGMQGLRLEVVVCGLRWAVREADFLCGIVNFRLMGLCCVVAVVRSLVFGGMFGCVRRFCLFAWVVVIITRSCTGVSLAIEWCC